MGERYQRLYCLLSAQWRASASRVASQSLTNPCRAGTLISTVVQLANQFLLWFVSSSAGDETRDLTQVLSCRDLSSAFIFQF